MKEHEKENQASTITTVSSHLRVIKEHEKENQAPIVTTVSSHLKRKQKEKTEAIRDDNINMNSLSTSKSYFT